MSIPEFLKDEADAFDKRIDERRHHGFIPDLRNTRHNEYFYKSFWRDPQFVRLYLGRQIDVFLEMLRTHCGEGLRILDIGCGAGQMSLELARYGYHITAIDISEKCIETAKQALADNRHSDGFGSLDYRVMAFEDIGSLDAEFDVIFFCGALHHLLDLEAATRKCREMLPEGGFVLVHEPSHERFVEADAAQVALIRGLLSITGFWYENGLCDEELSTEDKLTTYFTHVREEYFWERDKSEPGGQSPNDLQASGTEILSALRSNFTELDYRKSTSFIYRVLGGLRGDPEVVRKLADFLALYEKLVVGKGYMNENYFYFLGRRMP